MTVGPPQSRQAALVALNRHAHQGHAADRFETLRPTLESAFDVRVTLTTPDGAWESAIGESLDDGVRLFVAAGGDGTVHALVGAIVRARPDAPLDDVAVGAIGLGSSNDFHKPVTSAIDGVPVCLDVPGATRRDVLIARWSDAANQDHHDVIVVSGSMGVTAAGNARFNAPGPILAWLQSWWTGGAILWAALTTVLGWRDVPARLRVDDETVSVGLTNLSVLETPWLSGGLRYDLPVEPGSGRFIVALAHDRAVVPRLRLLLALSRGRFRGLPGTRWWSASEASIELSHAAQLEIDGEVFDARSVRFSVHPYAVSICGPGGLDV